MNSPLKCEKCGQPLPKSKISAKCPACRHVTWFDKEQRDLWIAGLSNKEIGEYNGVTIHTR